MSDKCPECKATMVVTSLPGGCFGVTRHETGGSECLRRQLVHAKEVNLKLTDAIAEVYERAEKAEAAVGRLRGLKFSDRMYQAIKSRMERAEAACAAMRLFIEHQVGKTAAFNNAGRSILAEVARLRGVPEFVQKYGESLLNDLRALYRTPSVDRTDLGLAALDFISELMRQTERFAHGDATDKAKEAADDANQAD